MYPRLELRTCGNRLGMELMNNSSSGSLTSRTAVKHVGLDVLLQHLINVKYRVSNRLGSSNSFDGIPQSSRLASTLCLVDKTLPRSPDHALHITSPRAALRSSKASSLCHQPGKPLLEGTQLLARERTRIGSRTAGPARQPCSVAAATRTPLCRRRPFAASCSGQSWRQTGFSRSAGC